VSVVNDDATLRVTVQYTIRADRRTEGRRVHAMNGTRYSCCDEHRLEDVRTHPTLTGIEYLEVVDDPSLPVADRQRTLLVHLVADGLQPFCREGWIRGGVESNQRGRPRRRADPQRGCGGRERRIRHSRGFLSSPWIERATFRPTRCASFVLTKIRRAWTISIRFWSSVEFSFKVECPNEFDCEPRSECPPTFIPEPEIDYLAKDYASFRRLMLDRMSALAPSWTERSPADIGVALVEVLAYVADRLSYEQDAIATEAYLGTCRRRVSARRHARLLDYAMHDGCNARTWVHIEVSNDTILERVT
jgi:hypothetical protein